MIDQFIHHLYLAFLTTTYLASLLILFRNNLIMVPGARWSYYLWFTIFIPCLTVWLPVNFSPEMDVAFLRFPSLSRPVDGYFQTTPLQTISLSRIIFIVWLIGVIISLSLFLVRHLQFAVFIRKNATPLTVNQQELAKNAILNKDQISLSRIYLSSWVTSPMICHIFKSRIYLPANFFDVYSPIEQRYILQHECVHYQRCDLIANTMMLVLMSVYWFNPIIRYAYRYFRVTQELSCDAILSHHYASSEKMTYGLALLKSAYEQSSPVPAMECWWNSYKLLKERCSMLKYHGAKPLKNFFGVILLTVAITIAFIAPGFGQPDESTDFKIANSSEIKLAFGMNHQYLATFGVINSHIVKVISYKRLKEACVKNLSHCEVGIYANTHCAGSPFAVITFDLIFGSISVTDISHTLNLSLDGNNLFINTQ